MTRSAVDFSTCGARLRRCLATLAECVAELGIEEAWVVGGLVRDVLLARASDDIDLVLLEPVDRLAVSLARRLGGQTQRHPALMTVALETPAGFRIDLARARAEAYPRTAALPVARPGTLDEDFLRRDFSINAMAVSLAELPRTTLVDPLRGRRDLETKTLRVLHDDSFREDPTRLLRGLRLLGRYGLRFDGRTMELGCEAVARGYFDHLSATRLRNELWLLASDVAVAERALPAAEALDLGAALHPEVALGPDVRLVVGGLQALGSTSEIGHRERPLAMLAALLWSTPAPARREVGDRLGLARRERELVADLPGRVARSLRAFRAVDSAYDRLRTAEALGPVGRHLAAAIGGSEAAEFFTNGWRDLASRRPRISGADLVRHGASEGKAVGRALEATSRARVEGRISERQELSFAVDVLNAIDDHSVGSGERGDRTRSEPRAVENDG